MHAVDIVIHNVIDIVIHNVIDIVIYNVIYIYIVLTDISSIIINRSFLWTFYKYRISALPRSPLELSLQLQGPLRPAQGDVGHPVMLSSSPASLADSDPPPARSTPSSTWTAPLKATQRKTACFATWAGLSGIKFGIKKEVNSLVLGEPEGVR